MRHLEDRTFRGYELYAHEVKRREEDDKSRLRKYKDRENVVAAMFIMGLLLQLIAVISWLYLPACR